MELKIWCKTFLNAYRCLEKITQAIYKIVLTTGLNSNYDTKSSANKIIELTERKITLINLKLLIEKTLNQLDTKDAKLLLLKYVDKVKSEDIAKVFNISNRTFFRKCNSALKSFELSLKRAGQTDAALLESFKKEAWILDIYNNLYSNEVKTTKSSLKKSDELNENKVIKFATKNYKNINHVNSYA